VEVTGLSTPVHEHVTSEPSAKRSKGRPGHAVWQLFEKTDNGNATCKFCNSEVRARAGEDMVYHAAKCKEIKSKIGKDLTKFGILTGQTTNTLKMIEQSKPSMSKFQVAEFQLLITRFLVGCGVSLSAADSPFMRDMLKYLHNDVVIPSSRMLTRKMIPAYYIAIRAQMVEHIKKNALVTISVDGWTAKSNKGLYALVVSLNTGEELLLAVKDLGAGKATGKNIGDFVESVIEEIESSRVAAVCTDSASNMRLMRQIVTDNFPHVSSIDCVVHQLNLMCADILKLESFQKVVDKGGKITAFVRSSTKASAYLRLATTGAQNYRQLASPGTTRFASVTNMLETLINAENQLKETSDKKGVFPTNIATLIKDRKSFEEFEKVLYVCKPIQDLLLQFESSTLTMSACYKGFIELAMLFESGIILNGLEDDVIQNPLYRLSFALDPKYNWVRFKNEVKESLNDDLISFATKWDVDDCTIKSLSGEFRNYKDQMFPYGNRGSELGDDDFYFENAFQNLEDKTESRRVGCRLIMSLHKTLSYIRPNSMACERIFSRMGWQNTDRRNRQTPDSINHLATLCSHWRKPSKKRSSATPILTEDAAKSIEENVLDEADDMNELDVELQNGEYSDEDENEKETMNFLLSQFYSESLQKLSKVPERPMEKDEINHDFLGKLPRFSFN
jgi:hypothetical protein